MIRTIVVRASWVMFVTAVAVPALASAQPSAVNPVATEPAEEPPKPRYPRQLPPRPLLLPADALEVDTSFFVRNDKSAYFTPSIRIRSDFELSFGVHYLISDRDEDDPRLASIYVAGLREIAPDCIPQLAVGAQLAGNDLFGELPGFAPSLVAQHKHTFRSWFALHSFALAGYEYSRAVDSMTHWESAQHGLAGTLGTRAQLQASPANAFELRVSLSYRQDLGDYTPLGLTSYGSQRLGGMWLISAGPNADLFLAYDATLRGGDRAFETITFGFAARRI